MKVTIIIPIFKVENCIESCLKSVASQSYDNLQCVLVDDATPDKSMAVVNNFIKNYNGNISFLVVNHSTNQGLSAARNTGIRYAEGDYLFFLDSDDEICHDAIQKLVYNAEKNQFPDLIIGGINVISDNDKQFNGDVASNLLTVKTSVLSSNNQILKSYFRKEWYVMAWNKLVKRSFILDNNLYFEESILHEDHLWSFMLAAHARSMGIVHKPTYIYKIRGNSITGHRRKKNVESFIHVLKKSITYEQNDSKYLKGKILEMGFFILHEIGLSELSKREKELAICEVRNILISSNLRRMPLSFTDFVKQMAILFPVKFLLTIMSKNR